MYSTSSTTLYSKLSLGWKLIYLPRRLPGCLTSGLYQPFSSHAVCHRHLMINAEKCVFSDQYHSVLSTICAVYVYDADGSGSYPWVLFSVVCNRGINILLQLLHAAFVRDAAEYWFTDDFSVPVDNIGGSGMPWCSVQTDRPRCRMQR